MLHLSLCLLCPLIINHSDKFPTVTFSGSEHQYVWKKIYLGTIHQKQTESHIFIFYKKNSNEMQMQI